MNLNMDVIKDRSECSRLLFLEGSQIEGSRDEGMEIIVHKKNSVERIWTSSEDTQVAGNAQFEKVWAG